MLRRLALCLVLCTLVLGAATTPALASGSADLYPSTGAPEPDCTGATSCRAAIEWRTNAYGPTAAGETRIQRRTLFSVFVQKDEQILTGSSSLGTGAADIAIWDTTATTDPTSPVPVFDTEATVLPAVVDGVNGFLCSAHQTSSATGVISTRAQEVAGAGATDNAAGYEPCVYTAPETGLYRVAFYGSAGPGASADGTPDSALAPTKGFQPDAGSSVNAWDITVRAAHSASIRGDIPGRVFTYVLAGFTGSNPRPVTMEMYLNTLDGYRYRVNTNGFDPNGFVFYGNRQGFLDADGRTPLNHDVVGTGAGAQQLPALAGGVHLAGPEYPLSFEPLAEETLRALRIPLEPAPPVLGAVDFTGVATKHGSYEGQGGTFTLDGTAGGTYEIVISRDGKNFDPGLLANRALRGVVGPGGATVRWDGKDNAGVRFPASLVDYAVRSVVRAGEYHAPMLDVESSVHGGPSITLLNPPEDTCPFTGAHPKTTPCTRVFFDDRAYRASSGQAVGDLTTGLLCPSFAGAMPSSTSAYYPTDGIPGIDSTSGARAFGDTKGSNANSQCPATNGTLGDSKGLDVWTYFPSKELGTSLAVLPQPAPPTAVDDSGRTTVNTPLVVPATGLLVNDRGTRLSVLKTLTTSPSHGKVKVEPDGAYTYEPELDYIGPDVFEYTITDDFGQVDSARVDLTVTPGAVDDTWTIPVNTTLVASPGVLTNDTGSLLDAARVSTPAHGSGTFRADGTFDYVPAHDFSGIDTFTYEARSRGMSAAATVTIVVTPTATDDDAGTIAPNRPHVVPGRGLLTNDHGTSLVVTSVGTPAHGSVVVSPTGGYTYTPAPGWGGTDTFTYSAVDGSGQPVSATVTVRVTAPVQLAAATDDSADGVPDQPVTLAELVNDVPGDNLTFDVPSVRLVDPATGLPVAAVTVAGEGTWLVTPSGVRFTPVPGFVGAAHLGYSVSNTAGQSVSARLTVTYPPAPLMAFPTSATPPAAATAPARKAPSLAVTGSDPATGLTLAFTLLSVGVALVVARRRVRAHA
ncbi:Ig-like domain-containing protein [Cellulomonas sp. URHE0023]|uniref:Ig-like domain-containing protein n=1 Tax=Cellulomonas sp. URHE0023 TaxID=1380354 RepID=UPI000486119C|nr:Ig-like domain-containing protein [Cellulomonas sp. URHE0023]